MDEKDRAFRRAFSERLRHIRKQKGLTQAEFAELAGIARASVTYYEREQPDQSRLPDVDILYRMCRATGVSADYFLGLSEQERRYEADIARVSEFLELSPDAVRVLREVPEESRHPEFNMWIDLLLRTELVNSDLSCFLDTCSKYIGMLMRPSIREVAPKTGNEDLIYLEKKLKEFGYDVITATEKKQFYFQSSVLPALESLLETVKMLLVQENEIKNTSKEK